MEKDPEKQIVKPAEESIEEPLEERIEESPVETLQEPIEEPLNDAEEVTSEESIEETLQEPIEKPKGKHEKIVIGLMISFCTLLVIYFGMARFFMTHFYFGSDINSINVSGKTVEDAKIVMTSELQNYTLNLKERGSKSEQIKAGDIGLRYNLDEELKKFKDSQDPYKWVSALFNRKDSKLTIGLLYDDKLLKARIDMLSCFSSSNIIEPKNASFQYVDNNYVIVNEVPGNKVDKNVLYSHVVDSILKREAEIDLESAGCYIKPQYNSKSQKIIEIKDTLNKYAASKITYAFGERKEVLDGSTINKWLAVDDNLNVIFGDGKVKDYVAKLADTYNTIGEVRSFVTSSGSTISIGGGDYGWSINIAKETQDLIAAIKAGQTITKEPAYVQTAFSKDVNDIGNTYVEIDMTKQHIWFYKNGSLIVQGDVVTGDLSSNHATPQGIYRLKYKERDTVLRGADYAAPVTFWMPFNGGIGIHDASWRSVFGGNIYKTDGSHGCVNSPYNVAKTIFDNIEAGTPVVCYY